MTVPAHPAATPEPVRHPALAVVPSGSAASADQLDTATQRWLDAALAELTSTPLTPAQLDVIRRTFGQVDVNNPGQRAAS